uniref:SRP54 domain-containing protein n=2 Tax=Bursaphelenchus xylophilus TaxID=6326 RepID=A0A1I7RXX7_BURXY
MIELFAIFGKGGLVLWCFKEGQNLFKEAVNNLISDVLLQQRNVGVFKWEDVSIKYKLDNEFDLVFLVVYQSVVQMSYADKLLTEVNLRFRDLYKNVLNTDAMLAKGPRTFSGFGKEFPKILERVELENAKSGNKKPKTYQESEKSKKTVASLIEKPANNVEATKGKKKVVDVSPGSPRSGLSEEDEDILKNREAFFNKKKKTVEKTPEKSEKGKGGKKGKAARIWDLSGGKQDQAVLDYSSPEAENGKKPREDVEAEQIYMENVGMVGKFKGDLPGLDENEYEVEDLTMDEVEAKPEKKGWLSSLTSLVSNKKLEEKDVEPVLENLKTNLIQKNVATEPAEKICESVGAKLVGKVVSSFSRVQTIVREAMRESLVQLLTPKRRVDILRDIMHAKSENRPYVIVFCGVNGVGKSTNLAKITFWLNENGHNVLIAAGDTFRAGAVEQLRTHCKYLNNLHPESVQLYEQGYGGDSAKLAKAAIQIAKERKIDVVLVDTAGRMQDNAPLMAALSSLIHTNNPDMVLFVGEALVGNEAVDQLVKFNQALADHSAVRENPRLIDGIVLTKFDTIDDKVGAAVSMTYITGQPIVFVGTGQTYTDLKSLNANAVVNSLLK